MISPTLQGYVDNQLRIRKGTDTSDNNNPIQLTQDNQIDEKNRDAMLIERKDRQGARIQKGSK